LASSSLPRKLRQKLYTDLDKLSARIGRKKHKRTPFYYRIAAAVVVFVGISSVLLVRQLKGPELVSDNLLTAPSSSQIEEQDQPIQIVENLTEQEKVPENKYIEENRRDPIERSKQAENLLDTKEEIERVDDDAIPLDEISMKKEVTLEIITDSSADLIEREAIDISSALEGRVAGVQVEEAKAVTESVVVSKPDMMARGVSSVARKSRTYKTAENRKMIVTGRILDADNNEPIPGVVILKKGTTEGVTTNMDGYYSIKADSGDILFASFIGMESHEFQVENDNIGDVLLKPDLLGLDEVVVIAYGQADIAEDEQDVYTRPVPQLGFKNFRDYIKENQKFPETWLESDREVVRIRFNVLRNGQTVDYEIIRSPGVLFSEEALRLIEEGPEWTPAKNNNVNIEEKISLRIVFKR